MTNPNEVSQDEVIAACYHIDGDYYENSGTSKMRMKRALEAFLKSRTSATSDAADAARFRLAIAAEDNTDALYNAMLNNGADGDAIRAEFDAAIVAGGSQV